MIIQIKTRDDQGRWYAAPLGEFTRTALEEALCRANGDGWDFLRHWIGIVCLRRAEDNSGNPVEADKWIGRYQAIRGIR